LYTANAQLFVVAKPLMFFNTEGVAVGWTMDCRLLCFAPSKSKFLKSKKLHFYLFSNTDLGFLSQAFRNGSVLSYKIQVGILDAYHDLCTSALNRICTCVLGDKPPTCIFGIGIIVSIVTRTCTTF
jgi:hypothetical protein